MDTSRQKELIRKRKSLVKLHYGTYREFSRETGLSTTTIADTLNGHRVPDAAEKAYWARKLKTTVEDLWG